MREEEEKNMNIVAIKTCHLGVDISVALITRF
jgi:hypothetical protein